jgi:adenosylmethionine-8-amino-7-oxononanoate aminotransferase
MNTANAANLSNTEKWQGMDGHHLHPFTNPNDLVQKPPRIIESAQGVYLTDSDGNELLDMMAGLWCVNMGYGQKKLIEAASKSASCLITTHSSKPLRRPRPNSRHCWPR